MLIPRMLRSWTSLALALAGFCLTMSGVAAPPKFASKETVVFLGDSITFDGLYTEYLETWLRTHETKTEWRFINSGGSGFTLGNIRDKGAVKNEPDFFANEVVAHEPTLIIASFGMFDGEFSPPEEARFKAFQEGIQRLIRRTKTETKARLLLLTPPTFDHLDAALPDVRAADSYTSKAPFKGYDKVLEGFRAWMLANSKNWPKVQVLDLHAAMHAHLEKRRGDEPKFTLQPGHIRPNATGHMVIASALVKAWSQTPFTNACVIDAPSKKVERGDVKNLAFDGKTLQFDMKVPTPFARDPRWNSASVALEAFAALDRFALTVKGLPKGEYTLRVGNQVIAYLTSAELAQGLNLFDSIEFPAIKQSRQLLEYCDEKRRLGQRLKTSPSMTSRERESEHDRAKAIDKRLDELSRATELGIRITPK